jgi:hypothetical protein
MALKLADKAAENAGIRDIALRHREGGSAKHLSATGARLSLPMVRSL